MTAIKVTLDQCARGHYHSRFGPLVDVGCPWCEIVRLRTQRMHVALVLLLIALAFLLFGCGTYSLGTATALRGQSVQQLELDRLACKDAASLAANSAGNQIANGLLNATVILAPVARERDKDTQRTAFAKCMAARGYQVTPP